MLNRQEIILYRLLAKLRRFFGHVKLQDMLIGGISRGRKRLTFGHRHIKQRPHDCLVKKIDQNSVKVWSHLRNNGIPYSFFHGIHNNNPPCLPRTVMIYCP